MSQITPELEVTGKVVLLSDSGGETERFAVLEVNGLHSPLVVPVERLRPAIEKTEEIRQGNKFHEAGHPLK